MSSFDVAGRWPRLFHFLTVALWVPVSAIVAFWAAVAYWSFDRSPPFELLTYSLPPVHVGGVMMLDGTVRRDIDRDCSLSGSRHLLDAKGARHDLTGILYMSPDDLRAQDAKAPGEMHLRATVPTYTAPGPALFVTTLQYRCNPLQQLMFPIEQSLSLPVEVMP